MIWRDPVRSRRTALALLAALLVLAGCRPSPTPEPTTPTPTATTAPVASPTAPPTATPTPTPQATTPPTPTATPTPEPVAWPVWEVPAQGLRMAHPPTWTLATPEPGTGEALLADLSESPWAPWSPPQAQTTWPESLIGVGTATLDGLSGQLTVNAVPARLTLDAYVTLLQDELAQVEGVTVEEAQVVAGWRPRGVEVGLVRGLSQIPEGPELRFWQVALLDEGGRRMLLVGLTVPAQADGAQVEALLRRVIQRVEYRGPAPP